MITELNGGIVIDLYALFFILACHVTYSLLLICRQKVEVYFRTISSESVIDVLQNGTTFSKRVQNLRILIQKKIPGAFGYTFDTDNPPHEYKVEG